MYGPPYFREKYILYYEKLYTYQTERKDFIMIILTLMIISILTLAVFLTIVGLIAGGSVILVLGDVLIFGLIFVGLIKKIFGKKKD